VTVEPDRAADRAAALRLDAEQQPDRREREWRLDAAAEIDGESLSGSAHARPGYPTEDRGSVPGRAVEQPGSSPDS
jgi:hypothetical protein